MTFHAEGIELSWNYTLPVEAVITEKSVTFDQIFFTKEYFYVLWYFIKHTSNERIGKGIGNNSDSKTSPPKNACLHTGKILSKCNETEKRLAKL